MSVDGKEGQPAVRDGVLALPGRFGLHLGGWLENVELAWRLVGDEGPVIAALGGISAGRFVCEDEPRGWWREIIGPGRALDSSRCRILGIDFLGGSGRTTGPMPGQKDFPAISTYDQARLLHELIGQLGIAPLKAIVGGSYGGMVALAFADQWPAEVGQICIIGATDHAHPMSTAWRSVQRAIVRHALQMGDGRGGLRLARALGMTTYRSSREFAQRFAGEPKLVGGHYEFPVESYLFSRGDAYAATHLPEAFLCLSESIDLHRVEAFAITVATTLVAIREDQLVPVADMRLLRSRLAGPAELVEISSLYGHDAFLKEEAALRPVFSRLLDDDGS